MTDYTTVAAVEAALGIASSTATDALIATMITNASAAVDNYCQHSLMLADRTEIRNGNNGPAMLLREYPDKSITSLYIDGKLIDSAYYTLYNRTIVLTGRVFTRGVCNVTINYSAGYSTIPADVAQAVIDTVSSWYNRRKTAGVSSKSLAGETISWASGGGGTSDLPDSAKGVLKNYRIVAPF